MEYKYKNLVARISGLNWGALSSPQLQDLMVLSAWAATEFGESLRLALKLHLSHPGLAEMAKGELETDNLQFGSYKGPGDHAHFLWHFVSEARLETHPAKYWSGEGYLAEIRTLSPELRVMSIVSREQELPDIFYRILQAPCWEAPGLQAFKYYLERHISLDSGDGGHAEMLSDLPVDDRLVRFYRARLELYKAIPTLFK